MYIALGTWAGGRGSFAIWRDWDLNCGRHPAKSKVVDVLKRKEGLDLGSSEGRGYGREAKAEYAAHSNSYRMIFAFPIFHRTARLHKNIAQHETGVPLR